MEHEILPITFPRANGPHVATAIIKAAEKWYIGNNHNYTLDVRGGENEGFVKIRITEKLGRMRRIFDEVIGFDIIFTVDLNKKDYESIKPDGFIVGITSPLDNILDLEMYGPKERPFVERNDRPFRYSVHYSELSNLVRRELKHYRIEEPQK
jgi:hypothetical protein